MYFLFKKYVSSKLVKAIMSERVKMSLVLWVFVIPPHAIQNKSGIEIRQPPCWFCKHMEVCTVSPNKQWNLGTMFKLSTSAQLGYTIKELRGCIPELARGR